MAAITYDLQVKLLNHLLGTTPYTPVTSTWLCLANAIPTSTVFSECPSSANGYARQRVFKDSGAGATAWSAITQSGDAAMINNDNTIRYTRTASIWGSQPGVGVYSTGVTGTGDYMWYGAFDIAPNINVTNDGLDLTSGTITIKLDSSVCISDYLEEKLLNHVFKEVSYTQESTYLALLTSAPTDTGGGTEVAGGSYARQRIYQNGTTPSWLVYFNIGLNLSQINFPTATADWGLITHYAIYTASSGGTLLFWNPLPGSVKKIVSRGNTFYVPTFGLSLSFS